MASIRQQSVLLIMLCVKIIIDGVAREQKGARTRAPLLIKRGGGDNQ